MNSWRRTLRLRRFGTASFGSYLLYILVFTILAEYGVYVLYAAAAGFAAYYATNIVVNKRWVFKRRQQSGWRSFYYLCVLLCFDGVTLFGLWLFAEVWGFHYLVAQIMVSLLTFPLLWLAANKIFPRTI